MATPETDRGINIEALSYPSPKTNDELIKLLDNNFRLIREKTLVVLPEYFLKGEGVFEGKLINDPMVTTLVNFAQTKNAHIVSGMIEQTEAGEKYVAGLFISPKGLIDKQRKQTPTSFERSSGIIPGSEGTRVFNLEGIQGTLSIAMCIESFKLDRLIRSLPSEILVNPRGFDLNDPKYGDLSQKWLSHNQDIAMMGKRFVVGATGFGGKPDSLAEIIDFEGNVLVQTPIAGHKISAFANLYLLREYREGRYTSRIVPRF